MTSLDVPSPNRATLRVCTSTHEIWGGNKHSVHTIDFKNEGPEVQRGEVNNPKSQSWHWQYSDPGSLAPEPLHVSAVLCCFSQENTCQLADSKDLILHLHRAVDSGFRELNLHLYRAVDSGFRGRKKRGRIDEPGSLGKD